VSEVSDGDAVDAKDAVTALTSPRETESLPTSRVGPLEVRANPVTAPVTGFPDASLPVMESPMRLAAAEVWSVSAICCSVCT